MSHASCKSSRDAESQVREDGRCRPSLAARDSRTASVDREEDLNPMVDIQSDGEDAEGSETGDGSVNGDEYGQMGFWCADGIGESPQSSLSC
jgi:hypothetical protein